MRVTPTGVVSRFRFRAESADNNMCRHSQIPSKLYVKEALHVSLLITFVPSHFESVYFT